MKRFESLRRDQEILGLIDASDRTMGRLRVFHGDKIVCTFIDHTFGCRYR
jgi:hypothetical protein